MKLEKNEAVASQLLPFNTRPPEHTFETPYFLHSGGPEMTNNYNICMYDLPRQYTVESMRKKENYVHLNFLHSQAKNL